MMIIPIIILGTIFLFSIDALYKSYIYADVKGNLELLVRDLSNEARRLSDIVAQIRIQKVIGNDYDFQDNPLHANEIKQILSSFVLTSDFYDEIIFYDSCADFLFSSNSTYDKELFFKSFYSIPGLSDKESKDILDNLDGTRSIILYNKHTDDTRIASCHPVASGNSGKYVLFIFSNQKLSNHIDSRISLYNASISIEDNNGNTLFQIINPESSDNFIPYSCPIPEMGWNIVFRIPKDISLFNIISNYILIFLVALILIITLSTFAIMHFMKQNYRPLDEISKKISGFELDVPIKSDNEYEIIDNALSHLHNSNTDLIAEIAILQNSRKNIELQKLVTGGYYESIDEFNKANGDIIVFKHPFFIFTCILFDDDCPNLEEFAEKAKNELKEFSNTYYIFTPFPKRLYLLSNIEADQVGNIKADLEQLRLFWEDESGNKITIGISSAKTGILSIPSLFLEARTAIDYRFVKGKGMILSFDEISKLDLNDIPKFEISSLIRAIINKNNQQIEKGLNDFISYLEQGNINLFAAKGLCFEIIRSYMQVNPDIDIKSLLQDEMIMLSDVETADDLINIIRTNLKEEITEDQTHTKLDIIILGKIRNYIHANCFDCSFSLQDAAESVSMTVSRLSSFYKKMTGTYLVDYVSSIRLTKARQLLEKTDMPIKEISLQVGYSNPSSFIRRFRQMTGMSPGDYRRNFR